MTGFNANVFENFHKDWALLTPGTPDDYNTMTIGWGGLGTLWSKPVATVYVKPVRYTFSFMERHDIFTLCFFPQDYRNDLSLLGTKSGRDGDKVALTSLTPIPFMDGVAFREASAVIVCRKIYAQDLHLGAIPPEEAEKYYREEAPHRMYIGEVLAAERFPVSGKSAS